MQLARLRLVERLQRDLVERAIAPEVVPQPAQRVRARAARRSGRPRRPAAAARAAAAPSAASSSIVASSDHCRSSSSSAAGRSATSVASPQRIASTSVRAVVAGARLAELREQHGEVAAQRPAAVEAARGGPQVLAERPDDRAVRRAGRRRRAADEARRAVAERLVGEPGLADPGLAGHEQQAAAAGRGFVERGSQPRPFALAADQHAPSLRGSSDRERARAGAVEDRRDLGHEVRREAAAAGVLEHDVGALGLVHAVDLVAGDVAVAPLVRALRGSSTASLDVAVIPRSSSSVSSEAPGIVRSIR